MNRTGLIEKVGFLGFTVCKCQASEVFSYRFESDHGNISADFPMDF